jgi:hypothetical protein
MNSNTQWNDPYAGSAAGPTFYYNPNQAADFNSATYRPSSVYDSTATSIERSICASAAATHQSNPRTTDFFGVSGSVVTPAGGIEIAAGLYFDQFAVGGYFSFAALTGIFGASLGVASGQTQNLPGDSATTSLGVGYGLLGVSKGWSLDPITAETIGEQWSAGLSVGPLLGGSAGYSTTLTSEFTSLYVVYIQFVNWVGYPGGNPSGDIGF